MHRGDCMSKRVIGRLESMSDYTAFALLTLYSIFIAVAPSLALQLGGVVLWALLVVRWLKGGMSW